MLDTFNNRSLALSADLLCTLECYERKLEVMRSLLKCGLLTGLKVALVVKTRLGVT